MGLMDNVSSVLFICLISYSILSAFEHAQGDDWEQGFNIIVLGFANGWPGHQT